MVYHPSRLSARASFGRGVICLPHDAIFDQSIHKDPSAVHEV